MNNHTQPQNDDFDYSNNGLPRDFDIRIEVAEQQEVMRHNQEEYLRSSGRGPQWHTSEYDF